MKLTRAIITTTLAFCTILCLVAGLSPLFLVPHVDEALQAAGVADILTAAGDAVRSDTRIASREYPACLREVGRWRTLAVWALTMVLVSTTINAACVAALMYHWKARDV